MRRVDPPRTPGPGRRALSAVATTRFGRLVSRHVSWKLDPFLLRISGGRVATTLMVPTAVLETIGARSGKQRTNAVIYFHDGDDVIIVASNAGAPRHPDWFRNIEAHPRVKVAGVPMNARLVDEVDRSRLWAQADSVFPAFERYRADAAAHGRSIPILRMTEDSHSF